MNTLNPQKDDSACYRNQAAQMSTDSATLTVNSVGRVTNEPDTKTRQPNETESLAAQQRPRRKYGIFPPVSTADPGPPPDGGTTAWLQVVAGHLMAFITWGLITSFGIFQSTYVEELQVSPSSVSWIGTMQIFMLLFIGTVSGRASDAGLVHEAVLLGSSMIVLGMFMASLSTQYWQLFLSQGVCVGLGMGILYMPCLSVPSSYFKKKKSFAVALMVSGAGDGGMVYPVMVQQLLPRIGLAWTIRCLAFLTLFIAILLNLLLRVRVPPRKSGSLADLSAFTELPYVAFCIGFFFVYWSVYFVFYYIDLFGYTFAAFDELDSINLLLISNALGIPGRVLPGFIASQGVGALNTAIPTAAAVAIILFCWPAVAPHYAALYAYAAVYGFFASAIQSLFAVSLASLTDDLSMLGTRMGMVFSVVAFASLTGSPIAGAIVQAQDGAYLGAQIWAGLSMTVAVVALIFARVGRTGWVLKVQV